MAVAAVRLYSYQEYLDIEQATGIKHEFIDGHVLAMAGASPAHVDLVGGIVTALRNALEGDPCRAYPSDLKISIAEDGLYTYPDVSVVCGRLQLTGRDHNAVMNPTVLVEVLSDSTEAYDRGEKFWQYQKIATFREYVLVSQHAVHVDHFRRQDDGSWTLRLLGIDDVLALDSIGVRVPVARIYAGVELSPDTRKPG